MVQWLRICLPLQGTQVRSLVREHLAVLVFIAVCGLLAVMCGLSSSSVGAPIMLHRLSFPVACRSYADSLACTYAKLLQLCLTLRPHGP